MNPVRTALHAALSGDSTLTSLLSSPGAIHHQRAPQNAKTPYVILHKQAGNPRWTFKDHTQWDLWTVKAVDRGKTAKNAEAIAARIDVVLNDAALTVTGKRHLYLRRETDVDYGEDDGGETFRHVGGVYRLVTGN